MSAVVRFLLPLNERFPSPAADVNPCLIERIQLELKYNLALDEDISTATGGLR